jgi:hypothetical protein
MARTRQAGYGGAALEEIPLPRFQIKEDCYSIENSIKNSIEHDGVARDVGEVKG